MKKKSKVIIMLLLTGLSLIMGIYDGGDCTTALIIGLWTIAIACERSEEK